MPHWLATAWRVYIMHPLTGPGYQWWSGAGANFGELTVVATGIALLKHWNCNAPRCLRHGPHLTADGKYHLCRKHHPDFPPRKLSLEDIHRRHNAAKGQPVDRV